MRYLFLNNYDKEQIEKGIDLRKYTKINRYQRFIYCYLIKRLY